MHAAPQRPQLRASLWVLTHAPMQQAAPPGHCIPQAPQWDALVSVSAQVPSQHVWPTPQGRVSLHPATQVPPRQRVPGAQWSSAVQPTQV